MGIRESLTLTWQNLDQSPLSLFTYCEEAMATKPNTNLSYRTLVERKHSGNISPYDGKNASTLLSSAALYPVPTQQGVQSIVLFYWFDLCCYIQHLTSKGNLLSTDNILQKTVAPKGIL